MLLGLFHFLASGAAVVTCAACSATATAVAVVSVLSVTRSLQLSASTDTADKSTSDGDAVTSIRHSGDGKCVNITLNISTDSK
jgi:hypothetical protein